MHARNTSANITPILAGAVLLCFCSQVRGQAGAPTQTFIIHGTPKTCSAITELDSALLTDSQQFFAGWTESDYAGAVAWAQACADHGWQVPWRHRIPLLQAQHDRALRAAQSQTASSMATAGAPPSPPAQAGIALPVQVVSGAATGGALPSPAVQAAVSVPAQTEPNSATGTAFQGPPVQAAVAVPIQAVPSATTGSVLPSAPVQTDITAPARAVAAAAAGNALPSRIPDHVESDGQEDSLLTDDYYKEHFHQESLWVAHKANLDIGDDRSPSSWSSNGIPAQMKNRLTADRIVLYCARKTNSGESGKRPLLWDLRWCEAEEASAYNRLVSGNEFPTAGRAVVLSCAGVDSYIYLERCMATLTEGGMH